MSLMRTCAATGHEVSSSDRQVSRARSLRGTAIPVKGDPPVRGDPNDSEAKVVAGPLTNCGHSADGKGKQRGKPGSASFRGFGGRRPRQTLPAGKACAEEGAGRIRRPVG